MATTEDSARVRGPCPECGGDVERRAKIETCVRCGWVPRQGAD